MPTYEIKSPQGDIFEINAPEGASQEEIMAYATANMPQSPATSGFLDSVRGLAQGSGGIGAAWEGIKNGATFGLGDELQAGIAAYTSAPFVEGLSVGDAYDQALSGLRQENQQAQINSPLAYLGGNVAGTLATGAGIARGATSAAPRLSGQVADLAATNPITAGATLGATQGGLAGFGNGEGDFASRSSNAAHDAILGGLVGGAVGGVASGISGRLAAKGSQRLSAEDIRAQAGQAYQKADQIGGVLKPEFTDNFLNKARSLVLSDDELINSMKSNKPLADAFDDLNVFQGQPLSLQRAQALDEQLGNMIDAQTELGKVNKIGKKLLDVQREFRNGIENATEAEIVGTKEGFEALKEGRKLWSKSIKLNDIERILQKADAADNKATVIKNGFASLQNKAGGLNGYTSEEKKAIAIAAKTGLTTDILKVLGSRLGPIGAGIVGTAGAGPIGGLAAGAASYGTSAAARKAAEAIQLGKANRVADLIANGTPTVRYTPAPIIAGATLPATTITVRPSDRKN